MKIYDKEKTIQFQITSTQTELQISLYYLIIQKKY